MNNNTKAKFKRREKPAGKNPKEIDCKPKVGASAFQIMARLGGPGRHETHGA